MAEKKPAEENGAGPQLKAQRIKEERRKRTGKISGTSTAAALVVGLLIFAVVMELRNRNIDGAQESQGVTNDHLDMGRRVDHEKSPPVGGDHWSSWQNCGVHPEPVTPELVVHSPEHGAVWINYDPELPEEEVQALNDMYNDSSHLLLIPYEGETEVPIVASSRVRRITAESAHDENLHRYVQLYERGQDVPEPGAACSGQIFETAPPIEEQLGQAGGRQGRAEENGGSDEEAEDSEEETEQPPPRAGGLPLVLGSKKGSAVGRRPLLRVRETSERPVGQRRDVLGDQVTHRRQGRRGGPVTGGHL